MTGRRPLRGFPLLMARWDQLHPYNALAIVEIEGEPDASALSSAAAETLREAGLGPVDLDLDRRCLDVREPVPEIPVEGIGKDLAAFAARELNRCFAPGSLPVRVAASHGAGATTLVALTYWHPTGDGMGTAHLLRRLFERLDGRERDSPKPEVAQLPRPGLLAPFCWARLALRLLRRRRCFQPPVPGDLEVSCQLVEVPVDGLAYLVGGARRRSSTVGQLLLASLAAAVASAAPERTGRRRDIALSSAVDLRPRDAPERWGLGVFLGAEDVVVPSAHCGSLEEALPFVRRQNAAAGRRRRTLQSLSEIDVANALHPQVPLRERASCFTHRMALAGGLSNLRPPGAWFPDAARVRAFMRFVPLGPILPLALGAATVAGRFTLTLTFRKSGYAPAQVEAIAAHLAASLRSL